MSNAAIIGWGLALVLIVASFWIGRRWRRPSHSSSRAAASIVPARTNSPKPSEALVWIENDGTARELTAADKQYVDTEFSPFDGGRPYIKSHYEQRNGWGEVSGYLHRSAVPSGVRIAPAPEIGPSEPRTPQAVADSILELARKHRPDDANKLRVKPRPSSE